MDHPRKKRTDGLPTDPSADLRKVPNGGGLVIQGPLGFEFPNPCQPQAGAETETIDPWHILMSKPWLMGGSSS